MDKENIPKKRKLKDTPLNVWVKSLAYKDKREFLRLMSENTMLWEEDKDIESRKKAFNNYRYSSISEPKHSFKIIIYLIALQFDKDLLISTIFPSISQQYVANYIKMLFELSSKTNHFNSQFKSKENAENQTEQHHRTLAFE